jgi:hypothetical protein
MINPQWGFNPIIIRMFFTVTLFQQQVGSFGSELPLGGLMKVHRPFFHTYHFSESSLSSIPYIGLSIGLAKLVKVVPFLVGRRG